MASIEGEIIIGRPVDVVFDYVVDQTNEPQYNPQMVRADAVDGSRPRDNRADSGLVPAAAGRLALPIHLPDP